MAYVLGFFTADGNMLKNKRGAHFIEFASTDMDLLQRIHKLICPDHKISIRAKNKNRKPAYRIQIGSKTMYCNLMKLGLEERKSKTIEFPFVPKKYLAHFVRGYFDGDGNVTVGIYKRKNRNNKLHKTILSGFICGSRKFLEDLYKKLKKFAKLSGGTFYYHSASYRLMFSVNDSLNLYNFMYKNVENNLFLSRKKEKFEKYFKIKQIN